MRPQSIHLLAETIHINDVFDEPHVRLLERSEMEGNPEEMQWLVHLKTPVTPITKSRVNSVLAPFSLGQYIPHGTFLLVAPRRVAIDARSSSDVVLVAPYEQRHKISPKLLEHSEPPNIHLLAVGEDASDTPLPGIFVQLSDHHTRTRNLTSALILRWTDALHREGLSGFKLKYAGASRISISLPEVDEQGNPHTRSSQWKTQQEIVHWMSRQHEVHWIQQKPDWRLLNHFSHGISQADDRQEDNAPIWDHGIRGEGQVVAVGDTGIDHDMCFFKDPNHDLPVDLFVEDGHRKFVTYHTFNTDRSNRRERDTHDETNGHGSHTGCSIAGDALKFDDNSEGDPLPNLSQYNGMAPKAKLAIYDFGSSLGLNIPENLYEDYFSFPNADTTARILSNSWGDISGEYDLMAEDVDRFMFDNRDFLIMFACGNSGDQGLFTLVTPAVAKNVLAIGSQTSFPQGSSASPKGSGTEGFVSYFSSRGPTNDGRIKPDVLASGEYIKSAKSNGQISHDQCNDGNPNASLITKKGTSMSCPVAAGNMALVRQYYSDGFYPTGKANVDDERTPSSALLKATVISSAESVVGVVNTPTTGRFGTTVDRNPIAPPNIEQGYGRMTLEKALAFDDSPFQVFVVDTEYEKDFAPLESLDSEHFCFRVGEINEELPFKATIVWTEPKSSSATSINLVNDLDLIVTHVDSSDIWLGNHHLRAEGHPEADVLNNVEQVFLTTGTSGVYSAHVRGGHVPDGPQHYALFISGDIEVADMDDCKGPVVCPNDCSGQGVCVDATCECGVRYTGSDCSVESEQFPLEGHAEYTNLGSGQWMYYHMDVLKSNSPDRPLVITMHRTSSSGDPDLYVAYESYPTLRNHDYANVDCDSCSRNSGGVSQSQITIDYNALLDGIYRIGVFGYCCDDVSFSLTVSDICFIDDEAHSDACSFHPVVTPTVTALPSSLPTPLMTATPSVGYEDVLEPSSPVSSAADPPVSSPADLSDGGQVAIGTSPETAPSIQTPANAEEPHPTAVPSTQPKYQGGTEKPKPIDASDLKCTGKRSPGCEQEQSSVMPIIITASAIGGVAVILVVVYCAYRYSKRPRASDSKTARPSTGGLFNKNPHRKLSQSSPPDSPFDTSTEMQTSEMNSPFSITEDSEDEVDTDEDEDFGDAGGVETVTVPTTPRPEGSDGAGAKQSNDKTLVKDSGADSNGGVENGASYGSVSEANGEAKSKKPLSESSHLLDNRHHTITVNNSLVQDTEEESGIVKLKDNLVHSDTQSSGAGEKV